MYKYTVYRSVLKWHSSQGHFPFADDVFSQTEPEEYTQANTEETEDTSGRNETTTAVNDADTCERLEGNNCLSQETESAQHTHVSCNTEEPGAHSGKCCTCI